MFLVILTIRLLGGKMKQKVSTSMDTEILKEIDEKLTNGLFRNRFHFIEHNVKKGLEGE